jgi:hypothetical protein
MANQGSQFRFNGDAGAPSGNAVSPRSLVGALGNIGNGGQPDVDTLMSQYAAQNNNDPEALVRARWKHACMRCVPGREACTLCAAAGASDARNAWRLRAARPLHGGSARDRGASGRSARVGAAGAISSPGRLLRTCRRALRPRERSPLLARAAARSRWPFAP